MSTPREPDSTTPQQPTSSSCSCVGVAYYDLALQQRGKPPTCFGLKRREEGNANVSTESQTGEGFPQDFTYYCVGYSAYPAGDKPLTEGKLPYCEGIELLMAEVLEAKQRQVSGQHAQSAASTTAQAGASAAPNVALARQQQQQQHTATQQAQHAPRQQPSPSSPSSSSTPSSDTTPLAPFHERLLGTFATSFSKSWAALEAGLNNKGPITFRPLTSMEDMHKRFNEVADRNAQRLGNGAAMVGSALYTSTLAALKPIADKLRGGAGSSGQ